MLTALLALSKYEELPCFGTSWFWKGTSPSNWKKSSLFVWEVLNPHHRQMSISMRNTFCSCLEVNFDFSVCNLNKIYQNLWFTLLFGYKANPSHLLIRAVVRLNLREPQLKFNLFKCIPVDVIPNNDEYCGLLGFSWGYVW